MNQMNKGDSCQCKMWDLNANDDIWAPAEQLDEALKGMVYRPLHIEDEEGSRSGLILSKSSEGGGSGAGVKVDTDAALRWIQTLSPRKIGILPLKGLGSIEEKEKQREQMGKQFQVKTAHGTTDDTVVKKDVSASGYFNLIFVPSVPRVKSYEPQKVQFRNPKDFLKELAQIKNDDFWSKFNALWPSMEQTEIPCKLKESNDIADLLLQGRRNIVVDGVPGTGKSYDAGNLLVPSDPLVTGHHPLCEAPEPTWIQHETIVMHPALSYEDFVEGLRPSAAPPPAGNFGSAYTRWLQPVPEPTEEDRPGLNLVPGVFARVCVAAFKHPEHNHVVVLDEFNRANLPRVFGELLYAIEDSKRGPMRFGGEPKSSSVVRLAYSGDRFWVPDNLYVVATMNSTDESVAPLDAAFRRRFAFLRMDPPDSTQLIHSMKDLWSSDGNDPTAQGSLLRESIVAWEEINRKLRENGGRDAVLGQSYLWKQGSAIVNEADEEEVVLFSWQYEILPAIAEIFARSRALAGAASRDKGLFESINKELTFAMDKNGRVTKENLGWQVDLAGGYKLSPEEPTQTIFLQSTTDK